jgi:hypothetical protein
LENVAAFRNHFLMLGTVFIQESPNLAQCQAPSGPVRADALMELSCELPPLIVLCLKQVSRQMPQRGFEPLALGDVFA